MLDSSALGGGTGNGLIVAVSSFALLVARLLVGRFGKLMWGVVASNLFVLRRVVIVGHRLDFGLALTLLLLLAFIEFVPGRYVLQAEDMFGSVDRQVFVGHEYAIGVWFSFVIGKI